MDANIRKGGRYPLWTDDEVQILRNYFPTIGGIGCVDLLPGRTINGIRKQAATIGLDRPKVDLHRGLKPPVPVRDLPTVLAMRQDGKSYRAIGKAFGICAASAANAVALAKCGEPAKRDGAGALMIKDLKRLYSMFEAGAKGIDIQIALGVSGCCVSAHRRRRNAELKRLGLRPLPPPGGGVRYSGAKVSNADRAKIKALFMEGYGSSTIATRTGISPTTIKRYRDKLIKQMARKGETLPGCDTHGRRLKNKESKRYITVEQIAALRAHVMHRVPVRRIAAMLGISKSSAYKLRDEFAADLAARGETIPDPKLPGKSAEGRLTAEIRRRNAVSKCIPIPNPGMIRRPMSFEDQLARVKAGAGLIPTFKPQAAGAEFTLGGVATGML